MLWGSPDSNTASYNSFQLGVCMWGADAGAGTATTTITSTGADVWDSGHRHLLSLCAWLGRWRFLLQLNSML